MILILDNEIFAQNKIENTIIMSGKCPMLESIDNWAICWARSRDYYPLIIPPIMQNRGEYFRRNKIMAHYADEIIAFIPRDQYRSGTWNCINEFRKMGKTNYRVFDEEGREWDREW
jgi:hypothetical protein